MNAHGAHEPTEQHNDASRKDDLTKSNPSAHANHHADAHTITANNTTHAVVFVGGYAPHTRAMDAVLEHSLLIAADSGWEHALASGRTPHILIGDMDSISPAHLAQADAANTEVIRHPAAKDHTDTELALLEAAHRGATEITLIAGGGDRPDHVMAMLHSLTAPQLQLVRINGYLGATRFVLCRASHTATAGTAHTVDTTDTNTATTDLHTAPGDTVSLVPINGDATVSTHHLQWQLDHSTLHGHASRGVSNIATGPARVTVHTGTVLAFITSPDSPSSF